ncbi:MAG: rod shape-determining protein RodA [Alphaproteobacteria bacterium]|nr:rod shape-determining protein RodA [Alphaproteobacteria bacterium]OJV15287.1 MAG: rod shape-determining protein RodA [Alphaproteobacteria bacterium 33-17]
MRGKVNYNNTLQKILYIDFPLYFLMLAVSSIGFALMYSAAQGSVFPWMFKQILHFASGTVVMLVIAVTSMRFWYNMSYKFYALSIILLIVTEFAGHTAMGATRWLNLGIIKLQPSDLVKTTVIMALARYFHNLPFNNIRKIRYVIPPILMVLVPVALVLKQPDLGTASIILGIGGMMFLIAGIALWKFGFVILAAVISAPIAWNFLHDYQKKRIMVFLDPGSDRLATGYNIIQSKISIGSGGIFGKGLLKGTQTQLSFLPEHQTDFIFAMLSEELGLMGGLTILVIYGLMLYRSYKVALNCKNHFGAMMAMGVACMFFIHLFINMAMVMELVPVVGVPLPFLSYGGTIMMSMMVGFGFVMCASVHNRDLDR